MINNTCSMHRRNKALYFLINLLTTTPKLPMLPSTGGVVLELPWGWLRWLPGLSADRPAGAGAAVTIHCSPTPGGIAPALLYPPAQATNFPGTSLESPYISGRIPYRHDIVASKSIIWTDAVRRGSFINYFDRRDTRRDTRRGTFR